MFRCISHHFQGEFAYSLLKNAAIISGKEVLLHNMKDITWLWGYVVAQLVEALRYKSEGRGFDS